MTSDCPAIDGNLNVQNFAKEHLLRTGDRCFMVLDNTGLAGLVTLVCKPAGGLHSVRRPRAMHRSWDGGLKPAEAHRRLKSAPQPQSEQY